MGLYIALDIEGTIADIHTPYLEKFNEKYGTSYKPEDILGWGFEGIKPDVDTEEFIEETRRIWMNKKQKIKPIEKSFDMYVKQIKNNHTIDIVTERLDCDEKLLDWLDLHNLKKGKDYENLVVSDDKSQLKDSYDLYVDDNPTINANNVIIFDQSYNRKINFPLRINSLAALPPLFNHSEDIIRKLMNSK
ncbi:MAG: hypothetical protein ABEK17_03660 [Candidatus Aenigmatarchaeota archaeon]